MAPTILLFTLKNILVKFLYRPWRMVKCLTFFSSYRNDRFIGSKKLYFPREQGFFSPVKDSITGSNASS